MSASHRLRAACALCAGPAAQLDQVLSLAATPPANELVPASRRGEPQDAIPLTLVLCRECGHLQLAEIVDPGRLFGNYVYVSGTSPVFVAHFRSYAETMKARFGLGGSSFVLEVGSNDGTLLTQFKNAGVGKVLGVDPAAEIAREAERNGIPTMEAFFSERLAGELAQSRGAPDLICANNVFAHTENLIDFGRGVKALLAEQGVFVFEVSYLVDVVEKLLFDTIYHEHSSYHAVAPLVRFFKSLGLRLFDAERVDTHGGSVRCYVTHDGGRHQDSDRLRGLLDHEREMRLSSPAVYAAFKRRISERGQQLRERLAEIRRSGASVAGFGAPAKLTTLMHEFGLADAGIEFIVDDSSWKQGLYTPGLHIPVVPASHLYERKPQWCIVFAWNFADSIAAKHASFTAGGGRFLVPLPELREIK
jgi:SAM-dependent methyltransferase